MINEGHYEKFNKYVEVKSSGCWNWTGSIDTSGYGNFNVNGRSLKAHRISYEAYYGEIPEFKFVLHRCNNPACVNPEHLYVGGYCDNMADRKASGKKHFRFTRKEVLGIRGAMSLTSISDKELASMFDCNEHSVYRLRRGMTWKSVKTPRIGEIIR